MEFHGNQKHARRCLPFYGFYGYDCDTEFPATQAGGWQTYLSTDAEYIAHPAKWGCSCTGCTAGHGPIAKVDCSYGAMFTEWAWGGGGTTDCPANAGGAYNLGKNPALGDSWTDWIYQDNCYDSSSYTYPSTGSNNYPHTWSYFHIIRGYLAY